MNGFYHLSTDRQTWEGRFDWNLEYSKELGPLRLRIKVLNCGSAVLYAPTLEATGDAPCTIRTLMVGISGEEIQSMDYFTSDWGSEFSLARGDFSDCGEKIVEVTSGRSSKQFDPWVGAELAGGYVSMAIGHGGNWRCEVSKEKGTMLAGLHGDFFETTIAPGESFSGIRIALAKDVDRESACRSLREFLYWNALTSGRTHREMPVVYNPWWPYEDRFISEGLCVRNAEKAKNVGCTQFVLDAGWFGDEADTGAHMDWFEKRGDWANVNRARFPGGLASLGGKITARGLRWGIWCEIEAIGAQAQLRHEHPEYCATRNGEFLGYACLGNPETRAWAKATLVRLIEEYGARWIKLDFNLDPGLGCDCEAHGHGRGDGLYAHYRGYYDMLDEIRREYPDVVLENCSSGGLRLDFETLCHTDATFLSDPDYVEHHFQVFWGATSYLPPASLYHFTQSQMRNPLDNCGEYEPIQPDMPKNRFDLFIRAGMVCGLGLSYRLVDFPDWCLERLKEHVALYREIADRYIVGGSLYRLTGQAIRGGKGDRWQAMQYNAEDGSAVLLAFRLRGGEKERVLRLEGLEPDARYRLRFTDAPERNAVAAGTEWMQRGICFDFLPEEGSEIVRIERV